MVVILPTLIIKLYWLNGYTIERYMNKKYIKNIFFWPFGFLKTEITHVNFTIKRWYWYTYSKIVKKKNCSKIVYTS